MSDKKPVLGYEEPDRDVDVKPLTEQAPDRRRIFRRLLTLLGLGITGALLSQDKTRLLPGVAAGTSVTTDSAPNTSNTVPFWDATSGGADITSNSNFQWDPDDGLISIGTLSGVNGSATGVAPSRTGVFGQTEGGGGFIAGAAGVQGVANTGTGVLGQSSSGPGVSGQSTSGAGVVGSTTSGYAGLFTGGNVGIGTNSPSQLLHVVGNTTNMGTGLAENLRVESSTTSEVGIGLDNRNTGGHLWQIESTGGSAFEGQGKLGFYDKTASAWRMMLDGSGHVGIGTTTPASPLEVAGLVKSGLGTAVGQPSINPGSLLCAAQDSWTVGEFSSHSTSGNPQFYFYRSRGTRTALAAVAAGDYIGSLLANAYDGSAWGGSSGVAQIRFVIDGTPETGSLPTRIVFATTPSGSNAPTERMRITNAGNVGIGTTTPSHLIQLAGGAYSDGSTWNPSSSVRWKENIQPLTNGLDTLKQLHPVAYNYKKTPAKRTMGFIAEEVGKVLPSVVDWDRTEPGYAEGYDQTAILALAVEAVKEQQKTIERLQERIDALEDSMKQFTLS